MCQGLHVRNSLLIYLFCIDISNGYSKKKSWVAFQRVERIIRNNMLYLISGGAFKLNL